MDHVLELGGPIALDNNDSCISISASGDCVK